MAGRRDIVLRRGLRWSSLFVVGTADERFVRFWSPDEIMLAHELPNLTSDSTVYPIHSRGAAEGQLRKIQQMLQRHKPRWYLYERENEDDSIEPVELVVLEIQRKLVVLVAPAIPFP